MAEHIIVVGAGAAGLMAACELAGAGRRITILEARNRCGGRIHSLGAHEFGCAVELGAEFVHGEAPVTHEVLRKAGLALQTIQGTRWMAEGGGTLSRRDFANEHEGDLQAALQTLTHDMSVAEFLRKNFADTKYEGMRRSIERMVEGYDAADPQRASIFALREEWMGGDRGEQARIVGGYGALVDHLAAECRRHGVTIRFGAVVTALEDGGGKIVARCADGSTHEGDAAILTVPLPLLKEIALPPAAREKVAGADIGFGNVIKLLLRFDSRWWLTARRELADLTFVLSEQKIPVWWTQHPDELPLLTGWYGGPKTKALAHLSEQELIETGLSSLAAIFGWPVERLRPHLQAARAIDWAQDPFAKGAYSWATTATRRAQAALTRDDGGAIFFCGEALYRGATWARSRRRSPMAGTQRRRSFAARELAEAGQLRHPPPCAVTRELGRVQSERLRRDAADPEFHPVDFDLDEGGGGAVGRRREIRLVVFLPEAVDVVGPLEQPRFSEQRDIGLIRVGLEDQPDFPLAAQFMRLARTAIGDEADGPRVLAFLGEDAPHRPCVEPICRRRHQPAIANRLNCLRGARQQRVHLGIGVVDHVEHRLTPTTGPLVSALADVDHAV